MHVYLDVSKYVLRSRNGVAHQSAWVRAWNIQLFTSISESNCFIDVRFFSCGLP